MSASDDDLGLATRAAWLYYAGELTQSQVAERLGITGVKAHRLIARAARAGMVRVLVDGPIGDCIRLEQALSRRFGLRFSRVVPAVDDEPLPLQALGRAAAAFLHDTLERDVHRIIGVGHGRTLAAAVHHLPRIAAPHIRFVSLLGGLPRQMSATPFDVVHRLAEKTGADAYLLPVPFYANTAADRPVLLAQRGVAEALDHAAQATLHVVGIGEVTREAFLTISGVVATDELAALLRTGAAGEMLGRYFDAAGRLVRTNLHERVVALAPEAMRGREVVAVAGGVGKAAAIRAVLTSGLPNGLITDEPTARRLLDSDNCRAESKGSEECTTKRKTSAKRSSPAALAGGS